MSRSRSEVLKKRQVPFEGVRRRGTEDMETLGRDLPNRRARPSFSSGVL
jgi:hypothetical protein